MSAKQQATQEARDFLAWWTSIETDERKARIRNAMARMEYLHSLLRMAYEAGQATPAVPDASAIWERAICEVESAIKLAELRPNQIPGLFQILRRNVASKLAAAPSTPSVSAAPSAPSVSADAVWISVGDRLPEVGKLVITLSDEYVSCGYLRDLKYHTKPEKAAKWGDATGRTRNDPTHWMPLPAALAKASA